MLLSKGHRFVGLFVVTFLIFIYLYPLKFVFLPLSTRIIMGAIGLVHLIKSVRGPIWILSRNKLTLFLSLCLISLISIISITFNGTIDVTFVTYPISVLFIIGAAYFVTKTANIFGSSKSINLIDFIIYAVVVQNTFSVIIFFNPALGTIIRSILIEPESTELMMENTAGFRLNGIGIAFFGAGIVNSIALIFCAYKIRINSFSVKQVFKWIILYVWIAITGVGMARTTFIGIGISILVFFRETNFLSLTIPKSFINCLKAVSIFIILLSIVIWLIPTSLKNQLENLGEFAFELFINYHQGGEVSSSSTNELLKMYDILPTNLKTWIIGDGFWMDPHSSHYYMRTDVGYMRLIFYFGITGLISYMLFQYKSMCYAIKCHNYQIRLPLSLIFILCVILNLKGFTDIIAFSSLFFFSNIKS